MLGVWCALWDQHSNIQKATGSLVTGFDGFQGLQQLGTNSQRALIQQKGIPEIPNVRLIRVGLKTP